MSVKHTPGPWEIQLATQDGPYIMGGDELIDGEPQTVVAEVYPVTDTGEIEMANARLIAAAPKMHEALTGLESALCAYLNYGVGIGVLESWAECAREALRKAEGR